jgi:hypothetical protein
MPLKVSQNFPVFFLRRQAMSLVLLIIYTICLLSWTDSLDKTKVTGIEPVDKAQDGVNNLVTGQLGQGGALQGVGDAFSKEGVNRAERGGKDDSVSNTTLHPFQNDDAKY